MTGEMRTDASDSRPPPPNLRSWGFQRSYHLSTTFAPAGYARQSPIEPKRRGISALGMTMRSRPLLLLPFLLLALPAFPFSCNVVANDIKYDLSPLSGPRSASRNTQTPPTTSEARVLMDLCSDQGIKKEEKVADEDQVGRPVQHSSPTGFKQSFVLPCSCGGVT